MDLSNIQAGEWFFFKQALRIYCVCELLSGRYSGGTFQKTSWLLERCGWLAPRSLSVYCALAFVTWPFPDCLGNRLPILYSRCLRKYSMLAVVIQIQSRRDEFLFFYIYIILFASFVGVIAYDSTQCLVLLYANYPLAFV